MMHSLSLAAVITISLATVLIAVFGLRLSRTTSDFYVASRTVKPWWNASAIGGEYLSAASFLGVAGLIVMTGQSGLWFPIGYTAGYLMLLLFVAAPLRRSRAYTIPDFAQIRFDSAPGVRKLTAWLVAVICWLYIVPQMHGASLTLSIATGLPGWVGPLIVATVVCLTVLSGGMRSVTFVQAFQYWFKLAALVIPTVFLLLTLRPFAENRHGQLELREQLQSVVGMSGYETVSVILALLFGTLGLPHVLVRFYTNPTGQAARKTTVIVLGLLSIFYLLPVTLGTLGLLYTPQLRESGNTDATVLLLPQQVFDSPVADLLTAVVVGGAFAAFLSTTSGLVVSLAGTLSQQFFAGTVRGFRISTLLATFLPVGIALLTSSLALAGAIGNVFAFTASTICPLLLLGIWWRNLTARGAMAGMSVGAISCALALLIAGPLPADTATWWAQLLRQPAAWSVPLAFLTMVVVSRATRRTVPSEVDRVMARLHVPES
ncbi:cation acetate symporter [Glutamicibacter sp. PS]|uniref:sodium/solute symporter n=1 Tax=Glutamicibacter sp. PS TaxID=3075634 RepID=UPI00284F887A|nr:cation acetate symporter [Glutamicibacter sp. PS]MDR4533457.1 cation acetate symporter [Glutamicibacter sp. PS]